MWWWVISGEPLLRCTRQLPFTFPSLCRWRTSLDSDTWQSTAACARWVLNSSSTRLPSPPQKVCPNEVHLQGCYLQTNIPSVSCSMADYILTFYCTKFGGGSMPRKFFFKLTPQKHSNYKFLIHVSLIKNTLPLIFLGESKTHTESRLNPLSRLYMWLLTESLFIKREQTQFVNT